MIDMGWSAGMTILGKVPKTACAAILGAGLLLAVPAVANATVYSVTPAGTGVTLTFTPIDSTHFTFGITGANAATGTWAGATHLGAFAFGTGIGVTAATATLVTPAGGTTVSQPGGQNANGCDGTGAFFCFDLSPNVALAP